jgi:hypothetical protein
LIQPRKKSSNRRAKHAHKKMIRWIYFQYILGTVVETWSHGPLEEKEKSKPLLS